MPDRRGCIARETPGHTIAGNFLLEGEATHIYSHTAMGSPLAASSPRGKGRGCEPDTSGLKNRV